MHVARVKSVRSVDARDARDVSTIQYIQHVVATCLCAIEHVEPLEHPDSRWHPDDLRLSLRGTMRDLTAELQQLTEAQLEVGDDVDITAAVIEIAYE